MKMQNREIFLQAARIGLVIMLVCSLFAASPATPAKAASTTFVVGDDGADFSTIEAAVLNAPPNTVIYVQPGNYTDEIDLTQMGLFTFEGARQGNLAIVALPGAVPTDRVVWEGQGIRIDSMGVPFAGSLWLDGLYMSSSDNSVISLKDFNGLMLTNVTIESSGDTGLYGTPTDAISINLTTGVSTVALYKTTVNNFVRDGLDVQVSGSAQANIVVEGSAFKSLNSSVYKSQRGIDVYTIDSTDTQLTVFETEFNNLFNAAIAAVADGPTPVQLGAHIYKNTKITNVAKDPGMNAIEIRAKGAGAHTVASWLYNNTITMPKHSDGIELEPASPGTFSSVLRVTQIEAGAGLNTPVGRGIVIDNNGPTAATTGKFKLEANSVKNTTGSAIDMHLVTTSDVSWFGAFTNNYFTTVNQANLANLEGLHFKVQGASSKPTFTMLFTGNSLMQQANAIKLENTGATFKIVSQETNATAEITKQNFSITPYIYGSVPVVSVFNTTITENQRPVPNTDMVVTWLNHPRTHDVIDNDTDNGAKLLVYANPLGRNAGNFSIDENFSPGMAMDDLLVYTPPNGYLSTDYTYYVLQDESGCSSIGLANTQVDANPLLVPVIRR